MNTSQASRAIAKPFKHYRMGYVAGIIYSDGFEWLLTKSGQWSSSNPSAPDTQQSHCWDTKEQAKKAAQNQIGKGHEVFVREYHYVSQTAKNLPEAGNYRETLYTPQP